MVEEKVIIPEDKINKVLEMCAYTDGVSVELMLMKCRKREIVKPRQRAMYFLKKYSKMSSRQIGSLIGKKDHATVINACKKVENYLVTEKEYRLKMELIEQYILKLWHDAQKNPFFEELDNHEQSRIENSESYKILAEKRLETISIQRRTLSEQEEIIRDLRYDLKAAEAQLRLYKRKLEYASMPARILQGE